MAWFGDGLSSLSSLKGQITNFTKEVLSEGIVEEIDERSKELNEANERCVKLQELLNSKDAEISLLRRQNCELQKAVIELNVKSKDANESAENDEGNGFFWDPPTTKHRHSKKQNHERSSQQEELAEAAVKIAELEAELKRMQKMSCSTIKDQIPNDHQNAELFHAKQDMVNRIIQMEEKTRDAERISKRSQPNEAALVNDFRMAIAQLEAPEKLNLLRSALKALETENENKDTLNERETVSSQSEAQLRKKLEELAVENARLLASVEQLDEEHQQSLEEVLSMKSDLEKKHKCLQNAYEELYVDYNDAQSKVMRLEELAKVIPKESSNYETSEQSIQTNPIDLERSKDQNIEELTEKVKNILRNVCIDTEADETIFEAVAREYVDARWKKDLLERKVSELMRELKESVELKDSLQIDCDDMQAHIDNLLTEIQRLKVNLPSIPEASEERVASLETETESLQEEIYRLETENRILKEKNGQLMSLVRNFEGIKKPGANLEDGQDEGIVDDSTMSTISTISTIEASVSTRISLEKEKRELSRDNEDLLRRNEELERQLSRWKEESSQGEDEVLKDLRAELEKAKNEMADLEYDLQKMRDELDKSLGQLDSKEDEITKLMQHNEFLLRENASLTEQVTATEDESLDKIELLNTEKTLLEQENAELKEEIKVVQEKHEKANIAFHHTKDAFDKLSESVSDMRTQNKCLEKKLKDLEELAEKESLLSAERLNAQELIQDKYTKMEVELEKLRVKEKELINLRENYLEIEKERQSLESLKAQLRAIDEKCRELDAENQCLLNAKAELTASLNEMKKEQGTLDSLEEKMHILESKCNVLEAEKKSLEIEKEQLVINLRRKEEEAQETVDSLQQNLRTTMNKCEKLEMEIQSLLSEKEELLRIFNSKEENDSTVESLRKSLEDLTNRCEKLETENQRVLLENTQLTLTLNEINEIDGTTVSDLREKLEVAECKCRELEEQNKFILIEKEEIINKRIVMNNETQEVVELLNEKTRENEALKSENNMLLRKVMEMREKCETTIEKSKEAAGMAKQTIEDLSHLIREKDDVISQMKLNREDSEEVNTLRRERDELVKIVQIKHNESLQYHGEIQRLTGLLTDQTSQIQRLTMSEKEKQTELTWSKNELQVAQQRLRYLEESGNSGDICNNTEHSTLTKNISVLTEKCNVLESALNQEQMNNRYLENQLIESQKKESNAAKELERLRTHLVEIESNYTEEALLAEDARKQLEAKLMQAEESLKNSSTVYTSASIRANQQVETLQQQLSHLVQQRDDIQKKLSSAEDKILSQAASLTNLQIVLEQFQRDKERDIQAATEIFKRQLQESHESREELFKEVQNLKEQLTEARKYVQAASRLSEELDKKAEKVVQLNQEVARLSELVDVADRRLTEVENCGTEKVDKNLIKNLLLGYVSSSAADKSSVLRVFATVLDFNDSEKDKAGLNGKNAQNSWFSRLSGAGSVPTKEQETSLSAAFVKFLESESKPKPQLPALPISSMPLTKPGHSRQPSTSSTQSTLLLSNVTLPTFPDFVPARNTGSILKEVLKDS